MSGNGQNTQGNVSSFYGYNLKELITGFESYAENAYGLAEYVLTHGYRYPVEQAINTLGLSDRAAFELFRSHRHFPVNLDLPKEGDRLTLALSMNTLGRLHIRPCNAALPFYSDKDQWVHVGYVQISADDEKKIQKMCADASMAESAAYEYVKRAMDRLHAAEEINKVLDEVIDHVEHVESVCFYINDRFYAVIERYVNLIDTKRSNGYLSALRRKDYHQWSADEILVVAALHSLFIAGRAVKFEEFNGIVLSAKALVEKLSALLQAYREARSISINLDDNVDIFGIATEIRKQSLRSVAQPWLRYRWIYGPTFQKIEKILRDPISDEHPDVYLAEFEDDYLELVGRRDGQAIPEHAYFTQIASACLARDLAGIKYNRESTSVCGWIEYLIEKIVASAVFATNSDYGMSSSLRNISKIVEYDHETLLATVHDLTVSDFFTCFVSIHLSQTYGKSLADVIASSVQNRMMFNRWHFFPGNFDRALISEARHWYYPPVVPDIAILSNLHRAGHARAQVKYSIRAPGPDMSRPPLQIADQKFRGFYDIRVVRMDGDHVYTTEDMLRARRRTLWLEAVFSILASFLQSASATEFVIKGFQPGTYLNFPHRADMPHGQNAFRHRSLPPVVHPA